MKEIQYVGGPLDGEEHRVEDFPYDEYHFPRMLQSARYVKDELPFLPISEDVYVRLLDTNIYVWRGIKFYE